MSGHSLADEIFHNVTTALEEDVRSGDLSAQLLANQRRRARVICREPAVLCGRPWFGEVFAQLDSSVHIEWKVEEGGALQTNATVCELEGPVRALLTGERSALNFLQLLSGVATATQRYVQAVLGTHALIMDTRKTLPGLRLAQKYAVKVGGGANQRLGLYDSILLKENHIAAAGGVAQVLQTAQVLNGRLPIQIEVETLEQLGAALEHGAKLVLLDNFSLEDLRGAVALNAGRAQLEASGGVSLEQVRAIAQTGVDRISIGGLTKHVQAVDYSMRLLD